MPAGEGLVPVRDGAPPDINIKRCNECDGNGVVVIKRDPLVKPQYSDEELRLTRITSTNVHRCVSCSGRGYVYE